MNYGESVSRRQRYSMCKRTENILIVKPCVNGIVMHTHEILQAKTVFLDNIFTSLGKLDPILMPNRYIVTH